jgi:NTE family protein
MKVLTKRLSVVCILLLHGARLAGFEMPREAARSGPVSRPVTALVLSGGGARGAAHIGVLQVLEELRVPVDLVVGTSMGSLVGGLYSSGYSPQAIETSLTGLDWRQVLNDRPPRKNIPFRRKQDNGLPLFDFEMGISRGLQLQSGLISGQNLGFVLQALTLHTASLERFDELRLPYRAVATDLRTGEVVVLDGGNLAVAIQASMAVPAVLAPVEIDGRVLVDGAMVRNLPVDVARGLGAERIIAVDISSPLDDLSDLSMSAIAAQSLAIYGEENVREQRALLGDGDLLITPDLEGLTAGDFESDRLRRAIEQGSRATRLARDRLADFAVSAAAFELFMGRQRADVGAMAVEMKIDLIRVEGQSRVDARQILARLRTRTGKDLDLAALQEDLERIYEIGEFQRVAFRLERGSEGTTLVIAVEEKSWGPYYLRFGLALQSNFEGRGEFSALAQVTRTQLNSRGAEWQNRVSVGSVDQLASELYQPLGHRGFLFVAPAVEVFGTEVSAPSPEGELERVHIAFTSASLDLGVQFRNVGELRVGAVRTSGDVDILTESAVEPFRFKLGGWRSSLTIDRFDNADFPRHGSSLEARLFLSRQAMGADTDYDQLDIFLSGAFSFGRNTILGWVDAASNLDSEIPFFERFQLGGFLNVSGLDPGTVEGNLGGVMTAVYARELALLPTGLGDGVYVGGSIEAGGAWETDSEASLSDLIWAGSVFVGADTRFGPLYLGYGQTEVGDSSFYLFLGRLFTQSR